MKVEKIASHTIIIGEQKRQRQNQDKQEDKNQNHKEKERKEKLIPEQSVNPDLGSNFDASV